MALTDKLTAIANAIRGKTNTTAAMTLGEMPTKIASIETVEPPYVKETYKGGYLASAKMVGMTKVRGYEFFGETYLLYIDFPEGLESIGTYAFGGCTALRLSAIPPGVKYLGTQCLNSCQRIEAITIPESMKEIHSGAFSDCINLKTVTFKGTPNSIATDAFQRCSSLTTINVPWAEGAVANAPWGATNATINYNYTEG